MPSLHSPDTTWLSARHDRFTRGKHHVWWAVCVLALPLCGIGKAASAQASASATQPAPTHTQFQRWDVISVKPNKTGSNSYTWGSSNDSSYMAKNVPLTLLLAEAYGLREDQLSGVPAWAKSLHWDLNAKNVAANGASEVKPSRTPQQEEAEDRAKVQAILVERFHLKAHTESKIGPVYDLVVAKTGSKLKEVTVGAGQGTLSWSGTNIESSAVPMRVLADLLATPVARNVIDKTGLTATYAVKLQWSMTDPADAAADNGSSNSAPDLFTALEEQLGLKLVPGKAPVTTLVVDSLEQPAED